MSQPKSGQLRSGQAPSVPDGPNEMAGNHGLEKVELNSGGLEQDVRVDLG